MVQVECRGCGVRFCVELPQNAPAFVSRIRPPLICGECAEREAERECAARARAELRARNIPRRYAEATFDQFLAGTVSQREALEACRDHAGEGIALVGPAGVGKTHLAACALKAAPPGSLFVNSTELLDDIKAEFAGGGRSLFARARVAPVLVLDDLGAEKPSEFVRERFYSLIDHRWSAHVPLIVTTNHEPDALIVRLGEPIFSRIIGLCRRRIEMRGEDGRRRVATGGGWGGL